MIRMSIEIIYIDAGIGYQPLTYMARLAAELFEGKLVSIPLRPLTVVEKCEGLFPRKRQKGTSAIFICPQPANLGSVALIDGWRKRYDNLVAWVFDSFWVEYISPFSRASAIFDHVFIAEREDLKHWRKMLQSPVDWLPWGSDVLRLGCGGGPRPVDLLRLGRQPQDWQDDIRTNRMCEQMDLSFEGRPVYFTDPTEGHVHLMKRLSQAKFTLSFSSHVSPGPQTHPKHEYITGRWTDALSAGATVAGVAPRCEAVRELFWEGALLELETTGQKEGLATIKEAVQSWSQDRAMKNYSKSLERLDWRWRFERLASALGVRPPLLQAELVELINKLRAVSNAMDPLK